MRIGKKKKTLLLFTTTAAVVLLVVGVVTLAVGFLFVSSGKTSIFSSPLALSAIRRHSSKLPLSRRSNQVLSTSSSDFYRWFARNEPAILMVCSSRNLMLPRPAASDISSGMDTPNSPSALDRIKAAKAYQRKVKQENDEGKSLTQEEDEAILEIERRDEGDASGSQFNNIKAALDNLKTLDEVVG